MDDLVLINEDKELLEDALNKITIKLKDYLVEPNDRTKIYHIRDGVEFLGYKYRYNDKLIIKYKKDTLKKINKNLKRKKKTDIIGYFNSLGSYQGFLSHSNTNLKKRYVVKDSLKKKYSFYKERYPDAVVIVKENKYYKTYEVSLIRHLFNFEPYKKITSFSVLENVTDLLDVCKINYIVIEEEATIREFEENAYQKVKREADVLFEKHLKIKKINEVVKDLINDNVKLYEDIYLYLNSLS